MKYAIYHVSHVTMSMRLVDNTVKDQPMAELYIVPTS